MDNQERQAALDRARQGDSRALGELLWSFNPYVREIVRPFHGAAVQSQVDGSDLIQDTMVEAKRSFAGFRGETVAEFVAWLRRIALRTAGLTTGKVVGSQQPISSGEANAVELLLDSGSTPSAHVAKLELAGHITDAIARLPRDMQQVLLARLVDSLPHAEIAVRLNRSEEAVRILYVRALARLRECCQDL
jgi:RNA polymerase sigma-70 factor (ECF subfamily)